MKTALHLFIILSLAASKGLAQVPILETLRHYNPDEVYDFALSLDSKAIQVARFDLPHPVTLHGIKIHCKGSAGAKAKVIILAHEAGTAFPQLIDTTIYPSFTIEKAINGKEIIELEIATKETLEAHNNQVFICITNTLNGFQLLMDETNKTPTCSSSDGGEYYFCYFNQDPRWDVQKWSRRTGAYAIDLIVGVDIARKAYYKDYGILGERVFEDKTKELGIDANLPNRSIAWSDLNQDGWLDVLISGKLYLNQKGKKFLDRTDSLELKDTPMANAFIDFNNDGRYDILFLGIYEKEGISRLYLQTDTGFLAQDLDIPNFKAVSSFSIADINADQFPDLFIGQLWQTYPNPEPNYLFINEQGQKLRDETTLLYPKQTPSRRSRGSSFADFDNDGMPDLFVTNYFLEPDELYQNSDNGKNMTDISRLKRIDINRTGSSHGTGCDWGDYDADGDLDLLITNLAHPHFSKAYDHRGTTIYNNTGAPKYDFVDQKPKNSMNVKGIEYEETHAGGTWGDFNNDGLLDLYTTTYYGCRYVDLYVQKPDHTFQMVSYFAGLHKIVSGEDGVWVDYNNDGSLDLIGGENYRVRFYENLSPQFFPENPELRKMNYVMLELESTSGNQMAIGAKAVLYADSLKIMQEVNAGRGQRMQKPARLHFGIKGRTKVDSVVVTWPNGTTKSEVFNGIKINQIQKLKEGSGYPSIRNVAISSKSFAQLYPNPTNGKVSIFLPVRNEQESSLQVIFYNVYGQKVYSTFIELQNSFAQIELPFDLANGIYSYQIRSNYALQNGKLVLERSK